ncbi:hypothetical protein [Candidatus Phytoplasma solani]
MSNLFLISLIVCLLVLIVFLMIGYLYLFNKGTDKQSIYDFKLNQKKIKDAREQIKKLKLVIDSCKEQNEAMIKAFEDIIAGNENDEEKEKETKNENNKKTKIILIDKKNKEYLMYLKKRYFLLLFFFLFLCFLLAYLLQIMLKV